LTCDGRLPLDEQLARFEQTLRRNRTLTEVLARAATLDLPGWYLVAGCLCQTVWNVVSGQPPEAGILDYDLAYFDASDLSWAAEDAVIQAGHRVFGDLPAPVQIRNQARVQLWYEEKFGIGCPPHESTIERYPLRSWCPCALSTLACSLFPRPPLRPACSYRMVAPTMQLQRHERGIHVVRLRHVWCRSGGSASCARCDASRRRQAKRCDLP